jgi:hypothetical protein
MKISRLETHDRLLHFKQDQALNIAQGAEDCLKKNRLSLGLQQYSPYVYLFAHPRTADDGVTKRMIWQPRLTKPTPQTNSYCFRAISKTDKMEICWLLPPHEMWPQYEKGNITEHEIVLWSIDQFRHNFSRLTAKYSDDLSDGAIANIYKKVATEVNEEYSLNGSRKALLPWSEELKGYPKLTTEEVSLISSELMPSSP